MTEGSRLCLSCGLCCNGALHSSVAVPAEDVPRATALGLTVRPYGNGELGFAQPCILHRDGRCSAYPEHPPTCQQFRCALLRRYDAGEASFDEGAAVIRAAIELLDGDSPRALREQAVAWHTHRDPSLAQVVLRAAAFEVILTKHFRIP